MALATPILISIIAILILLCAILYERGNLHRILAETNPTSAKQSHHFIPDQCPVCGKEFGNDTQFKPQYTIYTDGRAAMEVCCTDCGTKFVGATNVEKLKGFYLNEK